MRDRLSVAPPVHAEIAEVRGPAEQHVLGDRELRRRGGVLRNERDEPGELAATERPNVPSVDTRGAVERQEAAERAQHARLARPVRPDEHDPLVVRDLEREVADSLGATEPHGEIAELDHRIVLAERRTTAKNGAPKKAVTTPIGNSAGETMVRASTSASTRKPAPTTNDSGTTAR